MKAVRIHQFGGPEMAHVEEVPVPKPTKTKAQVRIRAAAVNPPDWMIREKIYNPKGADKVPMTLGQDFSGVIEKLAAGAKTHLREGDEVFGEVWGSFAEYALVPLGDLARKPPSIDFETAASIPMAGITAWQLVNDTAKAKPGMRFLIHGVGGGVGSFAAQFARLKGATVIGTSGPESAAYLKSNGVEQVIDYHSGRFEDQVRDIDVVIDPRGGETQARSWAVLKRGGMLINLIGEIDAEAAKKAGVHGVLFSMQYDVEDLEEIARLVEEGKVKPHIASVLTLDDAGRGMDLNQRGASHGKIILKAG